MIDGIIVEYIVYGGGAVTFAVGMTKIVQYDTRTKGFVRCPFYTKSAHIHHPLSLHNVYENQRKFVHALENL